MGSNLAKKALDLLLPPRCISCSDLVGETGSLCGTCWSEVDFVSSPLCTCCGYPLEAGAKKDSLCGNCILEAPPYDKGRTVFCYNQQSKSLVIDFKYSDKLHAAKRYAEWMVGVGQDLIEQSDIIVPVPLHWRRLFQRRYNQAALITMAVASMTGLKTETQALLRKKYTAPQVSLTRRQRLKNLRGAFVVNPKLADSIKGNNILLVDDVTTTGATINECTKALKKGGANEVFVLTLARTVEGR